MRPGIVVASWRVATCITTAANKFDSNPKDDYSYFYKHILF